MLKTCVQGLKEEPKKKNAKPTKYRKAPQAPKRFKSAFIFFSIHKHPEIRQQRKLENNCSGAVPNVAKLVSEAWRSLTPVERAVWDKKAEVDKKRYELERATYTGPWKIPASKRAKKDPDAPKRPMSAFLAYSKNMRGVTKQENLHLSNTEISKLLAVKWKEAPEDIRNNYITKEAVERETYKKAIAEWRANQKIILDATCREQKKVDYGSINTGLSDLGSQHHPFDGYLQNTNISDVIPINSTVIQSDSQCHGSYFHPAVNAVALQSTDTSWSTATQDISNSNDWNDPLHCVSLEVPSFSIGDFIPVSVDQFQPDWDPLYSTSLPNDFPGPDQTLLNHHSNGDNIEKLHHESLHYNVHDAYSTSNAPQLQSVHSSQFGENGSSSLL